MSNYIQPSREARRKILLRSHYLGCGALHVEHWVFLFFTLSPLSLYAQSNTNALPPLIPAYGEIRPTLWEQHRIAIIVIGILFFVIAGITCWLIFRPRPGVKVPPEVTARAALANSLTEPETGIELGKISRILRQYVIAAFGLPEAELTTAEFCAVLVQTEKIDPEQVRTISSFLSECDQRKFAQAKGCSPLDAARRALEIVSKLEERRSQFVVQK